MKEFVYEIVDKKISVDDLLEKTLRSASFAERLTFVWVMHPNDSLTGVKDQNGNTITLFKNDLNMDFMFNRPVFYDETCKENTIKFREYKL